MTEWIGVEDRLPESGRVVLAYFEDASDVRQTMITAQFRGRDQIRGGVWVDFLAGAILDDVTHWMPLPEPPR